MTSIFCCKLRLFLFFKLSFLYVLPWQNTIKHDLLKPSVYATAKSDTRMKNLRMMASLEAAKGSESFIQIKSFIRGYHTYKDI